MDLSDREKLSRAGFKIFRVNARALLIEMWVRNDQWAVHTEFESPAELNEAFKQMMLDHTNLRG